MWLLTAPVLSQSTAYSLNGKVHFNTSSSQCYYARAVSHGGSLTDVYSCGTTSPMSLPSLSINDYYSVYFWTALGNGVFRAVTYNVP